MKKNRDIKAKQQHDNNERIKQRWQRGTPKQVSISLVRLFVYLLKM